MVIAFRINNNQNFQKAYPCHFNFYFLFAQFCFVGTRFCFVWTPQFCFDGTSTILLFNQNSRNISRNPPGKKLSGSAHDSSENTNSTWIIRYLSQSSRASRSFLKSGQIFLASRKSPLLHFFSHQGELSRGLEFWRLTILFVVFLGFFFGGGVSICPPPPTARPALP